MRSGTAVILAGGKGSRMGYDKLNIDIHGERLIDRNIAILITMFEEIIVVTNTEYKSENDRVRVVCDDIKDMGPIGGIYSGVSNATYEYVYVTACDMPYINGEYIEYMQGRIAEGDVGDGIITRTSKGLEPFNAFYAKDSLDSIKAYIYAGGRSIYGLINSHDFTYIEEDLARLYSEKMTMFININTPKELLDFLATL